MMMVELFSELCRHPKKMAVVVGGGSKQRHEDDMTWHGDDTEKPNWQIKKKRGGEEAKAAKAGAILVSVEFLFCIYRTSLF